MIRRKSKYDPNKQYLWDEYIFLVVEDEMINYKFIEFTLKKTRAEVIWAKNGQEAIDICNSSKKIDIILMDIELPLVDGYTATIEIRKLRPDIIIIAQTAYAMSSQKQKCFDVGCNDYIAKPYSSFDLMEVLCKFTDI